MILSTLTRYYKTVATSTLVIEMKATTIKLLNATGKII